MGRNMLLYALGVVLTLGAANFASAQEPNAQGYLFFAPGIITSPGNSTASLHFGGGGEAFLHQGLAAGAELGYVAPWSDFGSGIGVFSLDGQYHFGRGERVVPFVTAGYSLGFHSGHINLFNYGVGANIWMRAKQGLRLEFRDHVDTSNHYIDFRIGYAFR